MSTIEYLSSSESGDRVSAIYTDAMARMYGLVALGIVTTGAAIWFGDSLASATPYSGLAGSATSRPSPSSWGRWWQPTPSSPAGNTGLGTVLYLGFTGMEGLFLSPILTAFTTQTIGAAFMLTAGLFVGMSAIGMTTKRDLSRLGPMLFIGLIGLIVISLVNMLLIRSGGLFLLINLALLPIFLGLMVWRRRR